MPVGDRPWDAVVNPTSNHIHVMNYAGRTVSVIDGATASVIAILGVGVEPYEIVANPTTGRVYVANYGGNTISVIQD